MSTEGQGKLEKNLGEVEEFFDPAQTPSTSPPTTRSRSGQWYEVICQKILFKVSLG